MEFEGWPNRNNQRAVGRTPRTLFNVAGDNIGIISEKKIECYLSDAP